MSGYIISIDQSTQGTKALLLDENGAALKRTDVAHRQIVNELGWVSHDPIEIAKNTIEAIRKLLEATRVDVTAIKALSISNQRETALIWDRVSGKPFDDAIVWQCARGKEITDKADVMARGDFIRQRTGINLSPYFPAAKIAWLMNRHPELEDRIARNELCAGTIDSWLVYCLTDGRQFKTDFSNASRTQLFDIETLQWNAEICGIFNIPTACLAEVCASDSVFGYTDIKGLLPQKIPICGVMGDSHAALFGHGCWEAGAMKATYGTGTSVMMNMGERLVRSKNGLVTSIAWKMKDKVNYVFEANLNYTGAVIRWLERDMGLIKNAAETQQLAEQANQDDTTYLVPAFSGLGAPYWDSRAKALVCGMTRTTGRAEFVKAGLESIAYQIADIVFAMRRDTGAPVIKLRVDGGAIKNDYLMRFQSDLIRIGVDAPETEELSALGAGYMGGIALGMYDMSALKNAMRYTKFPVSKDRGTMDKKYAGWLEAVGMMVKDRGER